MPSARIEANASSSAVAHRSSARPASRARAAPLACMRSQLGVDREALGQRAAAPRSARAAARPAPPSCTLPRPCRAAAAASCGSTTSSSGASDFAATCCSSSMLLLHQLVRAASAAHCPRSTSVSRPQLRAPSGAASICCVHQRLREARLVALVVAVAPVADQVDQEVLVEPLRGRRRPCRAASMHASGSSALTWTIGILKPLARSLAYRVLRSSPAAVVKPSWLLAMMWIVPPVRVARQPRQVQRLGHDPLAGERGVAVDQDRQGTRRVEARARPAGRHASPAARAMPSTTGLTCSRWLGLGGMQIDQRRPARRSASARWAPL